MDALIIGSSSDVGLEYLRHLNKDQDKNEHVRVFSHYFTTDEKIREAFPGGPERELHTFRADLSDPSETERMIEELKAEGCTPSRILFLPAPPFAYRRVKEYESGCLKPGISVGAEAFLLICRAFLPGMKKTGGNVAVMLTSYVLDELPPKYMTDYVVAKYALMGAMKAAAAEYGSEKLHINGIAPEMMDTKFLNTIDPRIREMNIAQAPAGRLLVPADLLPVLDELLGENIKENGVIRRVAL
ncbi:MAG: SDR family oxidoreductase [Lachnospiraceae bacterium]|nr:SDR family oxidoreductase [Lachnospiraceae bacterium]